MTPAPNEPILNVQPFDQPPLEPASFEYDELGHPVIDPARVVPPAFDMGDAARYRDRPTNEGRVLIRVVNPRVNFLCVGSYAIERGTTDVVVLRSELPAVMALIEHDQAAIEAARKATARAIARETVAEILDQKRFGNLAGRSTDQLIALVLSRSVPEIDDIYKKHCATSAHSVQSLFRFMNDRDMSPLDSVTVLDDTVGPPENSPDVQRAAMAEASANPLMRAMAAQTESLLKAQQEHNAALISALTTALTTALAGKKDSK